MKLNKRIGALLGSIAIAASLCPAAALAAAGDRTADTSITVTGLDAQDTAKYYQILKYNASTGNWELNGTYGSLTADDIINDGVSTEERRHFVDDVFRAVESGGARTVEDLSSGSVDSMLATFRSSAGKETLDATARLPFAALFGKYTDKVWNLRLIRWLRTSDTAADILLLVCGFLLHMLPIHSMGVIVSLVLTSLVTFEVLVTLRHLLDSHWDLKSEHVRVNTCIMMIAIAYVLFVKEQALFNLSTTIFGILFLVLAYNNAIVLRSCQLWTVPWIRHLMMTAMFAFVGFFVMVSAEHEISWYASMAGNLLMFDGISGLAHEMQKRKHRSQKKKGVKNTP